MYNFVDASSRSSYGVYSVNSLTLRRSLHKLRSSHSVTYISSRLFSTWQVWQKTFFWIWLLQDYRKDSCVEIPASIPWQLSLPIPFSAKKKKALCHWVKFLQNTWIIFLEDSVKEFQEYARRSWQQNNSCRLMLENWWHEALRI